MKSLVMTLFNKTNKMDEYTNSSRRLIAVFERLLANRSGLPIRQAWATAVGLDEHSADTHLHELYEKLRLVGHEIDSIERGMEDGPLSEGLYLPHLARIRRTVSIGNFDIDWVQLKLHLPDDTLYALRVWSELLPKEVAIPLDELERLLTVVAEARAEIEGSSLPLRMKEFLLHHLSIIEAGIKDYSISGSASITNAFHRGFKAGAGPSPGDEPAYSAYYAKVMQVWKIFWQGTKEVTHLDTLTTLVGAKIEAGRPLLEWLTTPLG